ncbi:MAG: TlyA family RNA methyltransferase [Verrucomicrobiales bacterium]
MGGAKAKKIRLDQALAERGLCDSREQAKRLILAGEVKVGGHVVDKPASKIDPDAEIDVRERPKYVSRGGLKLEGALDAFGIDPAGMVCADIGASTGGFTDCLLQRGAARVYAFDVGTNQLAWKIRSDPRVIAREQFNCRQLLPEHLEGAESGADLCVIDVSFISLTLILGPALGILRPGGSIVCLIKPQFELEKGEIGKGGIVRDPALHQKCVAKIRSFIDARDDADWLGLVDSPIEGMEGNREFLAQIRRR